MKNNIYERFDLINQLYEIESMDIIGRPTGLLAHAILNTINIHELVKIYVNKESANDIIASNILKRLPNDDHNNIEIYEYIFDSLKSATYNNRLRFRKILECIVINLNETYRLEYFSYFYRSSYVYEIRSALKIAKVIWSDQIEKLLLNDYNETLNLDILKVLIDHADYETAATLIRNSWTINSPNYLKAKFVNKLKGAKLKDISFLKGIDPGNFLVLLRFSQEEVDDETLIDCYNLVAEKYRPFAVWNLGKLGKWHLIKPLISEYIDRPLEVFSGFSDVNFE